MIEPVDRYPPPPYPRMPRYRVQNGSGLYWHEVTDAELLAAGDRPEDYLPLHTKPPMPHPLFDALCILTALILFALIANMLWDSCKAKNAAHSRFIEESLAMPPPPPHPSKGPEARAAWDKQWRDYQARYGK